MSDETQVAPESQDLSEGTSDLGQSDQSSVNQPNDPEFMRADYTRKTMELAEARKSLDAEKAEIERMKAQYSTYSQPAPQYQQPQPNPGQKTYQELVEQFGDQGAKAILSQQQITQQQLDQYRFESLYSQEEMKGRMKYGEESWNKHNYLDPMSGQTKNKVMDYRLMVNPSTGRSLSLQEAWNLANPVDPNKIAEETKKQAYAEMQKKAQSTPATPGGSPSGQPVKRAMSVSEAYKMAQNEVG